MRHLSIAMKSWAAARDVTYASLVPCFSDCFCEEVHGPGCQGVGKRISWFGRGDAWCVSGKREAGVVLWASIVSPYGRESSKVVRSYEPICNWQAGGAR
jgi:hypothetical protein